MPRLFLTRCRYLAWQDAVALLQVIEPVITLGPDQQAQVEAFAHGHRGFEYSQLVLQDYMLVHRRKLQRLDDQTQALLTERILFDRPWSGLSGVGAGVGRKALIKQIRQAIATLLAAEDVATEGTED